MHACINVTLPITVTLYFRRVFCVCDRISAICTAFVGTKNFDVVENFTGGQRYSLTAPACMHLLAPVLHMIMTFLWRFLHNDCHIDHTCTFYFSIASILKCISHFTFELKSHSRNQSNTLSLWFRRLCLLCILLYWCAYRVC